jgi:hypothetical protein
MHLGSEYHLDGIQKFGRFGFSKPFPTRQTVFRTGLIVAMNYAGCQQCRFDGVYFCRLEELERRKDPMRNETKLIPGWPLSSSPPSSARLLPPALSNPFELQLAELQRLYSAAAGVGSVPPLPPGWCHPQNLAADLMQRERLEQLGIPLYVIDSWLSVFRR